MSPRALRVAVDALQAELEHAQDWHRTAEANLMRAGATVALAAQQHDEATERVRSAQEALDELRGIQEAAAAEQAAAEPQEAAGATIWGEVTPEDVPDGAEAAGDGLMVLHRGEDETDEDWQQRVSTIRGPWGDA